MKEIFSNPHKEYARTVICCCLFAFGTIGLMDSYGLFDSAQSAAMGIPFYAAACHEAASYLAGGLCCFFALKLIRLLQLRYFVAFSASFHFLGSVMVGLARNIPILYLGAVIRGIGIAGCSILTLNYVIVYWFTDMHGTVLNFILTVAAFLGMLMPPVVGFLLDTIGFRSTYLLFSLSVFLSCVPLALQVSLKPRDKGLPVFKSAHPDKAEYRPSYNRPFDRHARLYWLTVMFAVGAIMIPVISLQTFGGTKGLSSPQGAQLISACLLGNFLIKALYGRLKYAVGVKRMILLNLLLTSIGLVLMLKSASYHSLLLGCALYGASAVNATSGISELVQQIYGASFIQAYTDISVHTGIASAVGLFAVSFGFSMLNSFNWQLTVMVIIEMLSAVIIIMIQLELLKTEKNRS